MLLSPELFENPEALAKLAALVPVVEGTRAGHADSDGTGHARKEGRRTVASSSGKVSGAQRIGANGTELARSSRLRRLHEPRRFWSWVRTAGVGASQFASDC